MSKIGDLISGLFGSFLDTPLALNVLLLAIILAVVSLFIWEFYKSTSRRNLIRLDLKKYNRSEHPILNKVLAIVLYLLEYIIIMPILIAFWFTALSIVLLLIAVNRPVEEILLIAAGMIAAIRLLAYFKGEVAKDLAKLFPFIALSIFLLTPGELLGINVNTMMAKINEIPLLLSNIFSFLFVIFMIEIVLRVFYTFYEFWRSEKEVSQE